MKSGRRRDEESGRNGERETIQHVEKQMAVREKRSRRRILVVLNMNTRLFSVRDGTPNFSSNERKKNTKR